MLKRVLTIASLLVFGISVAEAQSVDVAPKKGDKMISLNLGVGASIGLNAPQPDLRTYSIAAPQTSWQDNSLSLNVEFRWMFAQKWSLKALGGFSFKHNPEYAARPGVTTGSEYEPGDIPDYESIPGKDRLQWNIAVGADRYVKTKFHKLFFRYGGEFGFTYGRQTAFDSESEKYVGKAVGEAFSFRVAAVAGFDYFFNEALYLGLEIRPVAYDYSVYNLRPQAGLKLLSSDAHGISVLSNPMIKIGFRF